MGQTRLMRKDNDNGDDNRNIDKKMLEQYHNHLSDLGHYLDFEKLKKTIADSGSSILSIGRIIIMIMIILIIIINMIRAVSMDHR